MNLVQEVLNSIDEDINPVADMLSVTKVIQKALQTQKIKEKVTKIILPDEKKLIFNKSSGGGNIEIHSPKTKVFLEDGNELEGDFVIYISFRDTMATLSYNFLKGR